MLAFQRLFKTVCRHLAFLCLSNFKLSLSLSLSYPANASQKNQIARNRLIAQLKLHATTQSAASRRKKKMRLARHQRQASCLRFISILFLELKFSFVGKRRKKREEKKVCKKIIERIFLICYLHRYSKD